MKSRCTLNIFTSEGFFALLALLPLTVVRPVAPPLHALASLKGEGAAEAGAEAATLDDAAASASRSSAARVHSWREAFIFVLFLKKGTVRGK